MSFTIFLVTLLLSQRYMSMRVKNNTGRTEQKFVSKHLLQRGLPSINGVLNKALQLEQCQSQWEITVKVKPHICWGKFTSHYCVYLTCMSARKTCCNLIINHAVSAGQTGRLLVLKIRFCCEMLLYSCNGITWAKTFSFIVLHFAYLTVRLSVVSGLFINWDNQ